VPGGYGIFEAPLPVPWVAGLGPGAWMGC
jgi:hypothetical protein